MRKCANPIFTRGGYVLVDIPCLSVRKRFAMRTHQLSWNAAQGWHATGADFAKADLVLYFGLRSALADGARYRELREMFPKAHVVGCTTGGQIRNDDVDDEIAAVALRFDQTRLRIAYEAVPGADHSRQCGAAIGHALNAA